MNMSVLRILCATYIVPFLTPFVVSLRSLMNIAGEATMNQLLWYRRRALQRNLLGCAPTTAVTAAADTTGVLREYVLRNCCATYTLFPCS